MASPENKAALAEHFQIQSVVDLDFVVGQQGAVPVGMQRRNSPEFRRRLVGAAISYQFGLRSADYALKKYVDPDLFEDEPLALGDEVSDFLRVSTETLTDQLYALHSADPSFAALGAELTLYRIPQALDAARMLANRGLLLEVLPILRLCFEMAAWANAANGMTDEKKIMALNAQSCTSQVKNRYPSAGRIFGYLSAFSHWRHKVHGTFLNIYQDRAAVINASVLYRAMSLSLCLVVLDFLVEVIRGMYAERANKLITELQGTLAQDLNRMTSIFIAKIEGLADCDEITEIGHLLR